MTMIFAAATPNLIAAVFFFSLGMALIGVAGLLLARSMRE